ncbi:Uncharacterised protein [Klebsiella pneumoniae]|nr:Uncharacterised protein [Klebsiella pneumoniae]
MFVTGAMVNIFTGDAQANHRRLAEVGAPGAGLHKILKDIAVQLAKVFRYAEATLVLIMFQKQYAKIVIPHIGGEVIADDTGMTLPALFIDNMRLQDLNHREAGAILSNIHLDRNNIQFHRIAIVMGIIPVGQAIKTVIHHD